MTYLSKGLITAAMLLFVANFGAKADSATTGDLGPNIVTGAGAYTWSPTIAAPFGTTNGTLTVEFSMWMPPFVVVHASVNGTEVGTFTPTMPAFLGGTENTSFNLAELLIDGTNTITFDGLGLGGGQYTINRVTVSYELNDAPLPPPPPPPPVTNTISVSTNLVATNSSATVLHYLARTPLSVPEGSSGAGLVRLQQNQQKNCSLQKFDLDASGLAANFPYTLLVITASETNTVSEVRSDRRGKLKVSYLDKDQGKGAGKNAFPAGLDSVMDLSGIGLTDGTNTVAWAWVNTSPQYVYLVKRNLTPATDPSPAAGAIKLKANAQEVRFSLGAGGLNAGQPYHLALNSVVAASLLADANGRVGFVGWPAGAPWVIDLRRVTLLDSASNTVLFAELP